MRRAARRVLVLSALLWAFTLVSFSAQAAYAEINGNCEATLKGVDVRDRDSGDADDAIDVDEDEVVSVVFTSPVGFQSHKIDVEIAGVSRTASSQEDDGDTTFTDTVDVGDWAWAGAGLYKVKGQATLTDGSSCSGAVLVNVDRNPLTTVAGVAAVATTVVGGAGLVASGGAAALEGPRARRRVDDWIGDEMERVVQEEQRREREEQRREAIDAEYRAWASVWDLFFGPFFGPCFFFLIPGLLLTGAAMAVPGGQPQSGTLRLRRVPWRPRLSIASLVGGLLAGAGIVVLLQQYAVRPLTSTLAIEGLVIGLVVGLVLPSLIRVFSVMSVNGAIAKAERRLNEALGPAPSGGPAEGPPAPMPPQEGPQQ